MRRLVGVIIIAGPAKYTGQWAPVLSPACRSAFTSIANDAAQYEASLCDPRERRDIATFRTWHASPQGVAFDVAEERKDMAGLISPDAPAARQ